jgi:Arc/MetJ family transcription regulator
MRLTVDIDDNELARLQKATGIKKKSPAVKKAVDDYLYNLERRRFLQRVCEGRTDYSTSNDEIEASGTYDSD